MGILVICIFEFRRSNITSYLILIGRLPKMQNAIKTVTYIILNRQLENIYAQQNKLRRISLLPNKYSKCRNVKKKTSNDHYGCEMYSNDKKAIISLVVIAVKVKLHSMDLENIFFVSKLVVLGHEHLCTFRCMSLCICHIQVVLFVMSFSNILRFNIETKNRTKHDIRKDEMFSNINVYFAYY